MNNKELLDIAIKSLQSLKDNKLDDVSVNTRNMGDGTLNLSIDIDYFELTKSDEEVLRAEVTI